MDRDFIKQTMMAYYRTMSNGAGLKWNDEKAAAVGVLVDELIDRQITVKPPAPTDYPPREWTEADETARNEARLLAAAKEEE